MNVSPITTSPSMKAGLYFAEPGVLFNPKASYIDTKGQKISPEGVRYFEDKKVPIHIKNRFQEVPLIKNLAKTHDVFINYQSANFIESMQNITRIKVLYADYSKKFATEYNAEGIARYAEDAIDIAFGKLCDLRANRALTGELTLFEKIIDKIKKIKLLKR